MKKYVLIIQTPSNHFKVLVLKAPNKNALFPIYRNQGVSVSIQEYSTHAFNMAKMQAGQYNGLKKDETVTLFSALAAS